MQRRIFTPLILLPILLCGGCADASGASVLEVSSVETMSADGESAVTKDVFAMDTYMRLTAYGDGAERAVEEAASYIAEMDALLSTGLETSEISQLNSNGTGTLSPDGAAILESAIAICQDTGGAFQPLLYPVLEAWGFPDRAYRVPEQQELEQLLKLADLSKLQFDLGTGDVSFDQAGMKLDFGGIAKGYVSSQIREIFISCGVTSGMVSLGGNVQVMGTKPDGSPWRVGVQNPDSNGTYLGILEVQDKAVITSGGYERYFEQDGEAYHHIIDPATGYPAQSGLTSVTIVSDDGTLADGLSTALFVMGLERAFAYWQAHSDQFDAILLTDEGELYVTEGIQDVFSSDDTWELIEGGQG
ncbi:MAG: FAD:protein FMN transferase [Ruminococcus sp.]